MRGDRWTRIPDHLSRPAHLFDESDAPDPDTLRLKAFEKAEIRRALHGPQRGEIILALESLHYLIDNERMEAMRGIEHVGMGAAERSTIAAFFQSLSGHLKRLIEAVPEPEETPSEDDVDRVQSLLEDLKKELAQWPRDNMKEIVDSGYRAALVGICVGVGALFGYPLIGAGIGAGMFGGNKLGEAIGKAIKSGSTGSTGG